MDDQSLRQAVSFITSNVCTTTVAWGTVPLKLLGRKAVIANNVRLASISRMFGLYRAHYAGYGAAHTNVLHAEGQARVRSHVLVVKHVHLNDLPHAVHRGRRCSGYGRGQGVHRRSRRLYKTKAPFKKRQLETQRRELRRAATGPRINMTTPAPRRERKKGVLQGRLGPEGPLRRGRGGAA